jgi:methylase of polypeptide subunit release factors
MASLSKTYTQEKKLGQIYTPDYIVAKILDEVGFLGSTLLGKKVLDPACGDGRFLVQVVERIIANSPKEQLAQNLQFVHGWDIDENAVALCVENLNLLIQDFDFQINWNINKVDALSKKSSTDLFSTPTETFDFIVGNPPYIRIQHLEEEQRKYIQTHYSFCKNGSTDIYIAFYELAIALLSPEGICGFITPNTFFYTETAKPMRAYFAKHRLLKKITNYAEIQVFNNATTYSAIVIFDKNTHDFLTYEKALTEKTFAEKQLNQHILNERIWQLSVDEQVKIEGQRLGDIAKIHVGITTLCDKAYMMTLVEKQDNFLVLNSRLKGAVKLEIGILRPIIKASTLKNTAAEIKEYVLFPYRNGQIISELELQNEFPLAYQYLCDVREELDKRDAGKPNTVAWYAYGRSQGLQTSFGRKILFSPMNLRPNFILSDNEEATFYSGYCIKYNGDVNALLVQLNSDRMQNYISISSRDFRGGWKAYNKKILEDFIIFD